MGNEEQNEPRFKCMLDHKILLESDLIEGKCPICGTIPIKMCKMDHLCTCIGDLHDGYQECPVCREFTCPCGSHDVVVISRVTGYLAEVGGWGNGKKAEFRDRARYDVA